MTLRSNWRVIALAGLAIALGLLLARELVRSPSAPPALIQEASVTVPEIETPKIVKPPPPETFTAFDERMPFNPSRTPIVRPRNAEAADPAPEPPSLRLVGVVIEGDRKSAVIRVEGEESSEHVRIGDEIGGWELFEITPRGVGLRRGEEVRTYDLHESREGDEDAARPESAD